VLLSAPHSIDFNHKYNNNKMTLEDLGYTPTFENFRKENNLLSFEVGRVVSEHRERYVVKTVEGEFDSEIIGNLRFTALGRANFPAVGDWVALSIFDDDRALIHAIFPRRTIVERQAVGKQGEKQIIATNVDYAFIVQAVDRDFNLNRIERYLTLCHASNVIPIVILNKIDLLNELELNELVAKVEERIQQVPIITASSERLNGIETIKAQLQKGKTYCLLGSSGVGKSTLSNRLWGTQLLRTNAISASTNKGRHVTSHRELLVLESGGILIDNPGLREVGVADSLQGLEITFDKILQIANECKFKDCTHTSEKGCAVVAAVERGELDKSYYNNYLKIGRENAHYESTIAQKRKRDKEFGKMLKNYKKNPNISGSDTF
jgi:ribosome biogenesis GTPase / thiamine phosphate phosphatase